MTNKLGKENEANQINVIRGTYSFQYEMTVILKL